MCVHLGKMTRHDTEGSRQCPMKRIRQTLSEAMPCLKLGMTDASSEAWIGPLFLHVSFIPVTCLPFLLGRQHACNIVTTGSCCLPSRQCFAMTWQRRKGKGASLKQVLLSCLQKAERLVSPSILGTKKPNISRLRQSVTRKTLEPRSLKISLQRPGPS